MMIRYLVATLIAISLMMAGGATQPQAQPKPGALQLQLDASAAAGEVGNGQRLQITTVVWPQVWGNPPSTHIRESFARGLEVVRADTFQGVCTHDASSYDCEVPLPGPQVALISVVVRVTPGPATCNGRARFRPTASTGDYTTATVGVYGVYCQYFPTWRQ